MQALKLQTLIAMPLIVQGEVQGVLEVLTIKEKGYVQSDVDILSVVANAVAAGMIRKRLIDELRMKNIELETQTQKTLEASDTLKKFLATFSHELRSPLNSIIGFSDLASAIGITGPSRRTRCCPDGATSIVTYCVAPWVLLSWITWPQRAI